MKYTDSKHHGARAALLSVQCSTLLQLIHSHTNQPKAFVVREDQYVVIRRNISVVRRRQGKTEKYEGETPVRDWRKGRGNRPMELIPVASV